MTILRFPLLFDGAYGTLYASRTKNPAHQADEAVLNEPDTVRGMHEDYIHAGAQAIKTDTFALPVLLKQDPAKAGQILKQAIRLATEAARNHPDVLIFADLGPVHPGDDAIEIYSQLFSQFLAEGIDCFLVETLSSLDGIAEAARLLKEQSPSSILIVSCAVGADGLCTSGLSGREMLGRLNEDPHIDAMGFNCLSGPSHMLRQLQDLPSFDKPLSFMPNAGYPQVNQRRSVYSGTPDYFADRMRAMVHEGASILGGCCGTTPEHIHALSLLLQEIPASSPSAKSRAEMENAPDNQSSSSDSPVPERTDSSDSSQCRYREPDRLDRNLWEGKKSILVELDPPASDNVSRFLEHAARLHAAGCDLLTIADNPIGRPRADSCLLACKVRRELGMDVLPHMTCRDRNLNAIRALLLGLSMEDIHQVLLVTGDPLPEETRNEVRTVFSFNSRTLAAYVRTLEAEGVCRPFHTFGALDLNARNFDVQLRLARQKEEAGIEGFLTQPVFSKRALANLHRARQKLKGQIYGGIMPLVSWKNAMFLKNEISGMDIPDETAALYKDKNRKECEAISLDLCTRIAQAMKEDVDGFYLMTPFQRIPLICALIERIHALNPSPEQFID